MYPLSSNLICEGSQTKFNHFNDPSLKKTSISNSWQVSGDCLETVHFTDFLAEIMFYELYFFIKNDNELAFLEKNPLKQALFMYFATLC